MLSAVAGIIDRNGGLRVVVGPLSNMFDHVARGERLYVHPTLAVQEPVKAEDVVPVMTEYVRIRRMFP